MTEQSDELVKEVEVIEETTEVVETEVKTEVEATEEEPKQSKSQNAKQRLRRKLRESDEAKTALEERNKQLEDRFSTLETKLDGVINPPAARPLRVNFETEEDYEDALWDFRSPKSEVTKPEPVSTPEPKQDIVSSEVRESWNEQMDNGYEKYDDFEEVIYNKQLVMTDPMTFAVMESEVGGDIAYFLGKNPREAERISQLSQPAQIRAIDKIAGKFAKNTTSAPDPIKPIGGKGDVDTEKVDPLLMGATFT